MPAACSKWDDCIGSIAPSGLLAGRTGRRLYGYAEINIVAIGDTTIDTAGKPVYPYAMGRAYRGYPSGRLVRSITEPVTTYFTAAPGSTGNSGDTSANTASQTTTLLWSAKDSGGYQVQNR